MTRQGGQLAVAWVMANRVLAQQKGYFTDDPKPTTLYNVVTMKKQFTALEADGGNLQAWTSKYPQVLDGRVGSMQLR